MAQTIMILNLIKISLTLSYADQSAYYIKTIRKVISPKPNVHDRNETNIQTNLNFVAIIPENYRSNRFIEL